MCVWSRISYNGLFKHSSTCHKGKELNLVSFSFLILIFVTSPDYCCVIGRTNTMMIVKLNGDKVQFGCVFKL